jgi:ribose transport system substrate-binding protein
MARLDRRLLIGLVILGLIGGCNRGGSTQEGAPQKVAFVMKTLNHPFFLDMQRGAQEAADRERIQLVVQAAEREIDVAKQMQIIETLLVTGPRALEVTPRGSR